MTLIVNFCGRSLFDDVALIPLSSCCEEGGGGLGRYTDARGVNFMLKSRDVSVISCGARSHIIPEETTTSGWRVSR